MHGDLKPINPRSLTIITNPSEEEKNKLSTPGKRGLIPDLNTLRMCFERLSSPDCYGGSYVELPVVDHGGFGDSPDVESIMSGFLRFDKVVINGRLQWVYNGAVKHY